MLKITFTNLSGKVESKQDFYNDQHAKCQKQLKEGHDVCVYQKEKWKEAAVKKACAEPRSYIIKIQDGKIYRGNRNTLWPVESEETSVEISDDENDNVYDEIQVSNEKLEIKSENQPSPKTAVRTTRYGRVVKPPRRYDEYDVIKEREMLYIEKHCLSEKHVYQTLLVLRLLFLTAGNIISQSYYIEYVYCEFINVIIRVIISH